MILILDVWMVLCGWIYQLHNPIKSAVTLDIYLSKKKEKLWCMINWFNFIVNSCHKSTRQNQYSLRKIKHKSCHTKQSKQKQTMEICGTRSKYRILDEVLGVVQAFFIASKSGRHLVRWFIYSYCKARY